MTYERFLDVVERIDRERVDQSWKAALERAPYDIEFRVAADGITKWIHARSELEFDSAGNVLGGFGTVQDITDMKHAEEALRQSEERLRAIGNTAGDAIIVIKEGGLIVSINQAAEQKFGYAASDIVGENIFILTTGPHRTAHAAGAQAIGMALHELATSAGKYGPLSNSKGRIEIAWRLDRAAASDHFTLSWVEAGGPPVFPPDNSDSERPLLRLPRMELDAEVTLVYAHEGLCWRLECLAERVLEIPSGFEAVREASAERKL